MSKYRVCLIEDDETYEEMIREGIEKHVPEARVVTFDDLYEACSAAGRVDLCIIDMSAISPIYLGPAGAYSLVAHWVQAHPHTPIIVASGVSTGFVEEVVERVKGLGFDVVAEHFRALEGFEGEAFRTVLRKYLPS